MLGDRFLKEADVGFTAAPFLSARLSVAPNDEALLLLASDGLWDVVPAPRAAALAARAVAEVRSGSAGSAVPSAAAGVAAAAAEALMKAALALRSRDDISILVLHVLPVDVAADLARTAGAAGTSVPGLL